MPVAFLGARSISAARRYGVVDGRRDGNPAVFVTERTTNSTPGSLLTGIGFSARHEHLPVSVHRDGWSSVVSLGGGRFHGRYRWTYHGLTREVQASGAGRDSTTAVSQRPTA